MAYAGWGGTLVYAGSLLADSYDLSAAAVAPLLALAAAAYFPAAFAGRRRLGGDVGRVLASLALALAAGSLLFGVLRLSAAFSVAIFALLVLTAGARTVIGSAVGVRTLPHHTVSVGAMRSVATQLGYLLGAAVGGVALDIGGYTALGIALASFFGLGALRHLEWWPYRALRCALPLRASRASSQHRRPIGREAPSTAPRQVRGPHLLFARRAKACRALSYVIDVSNRSYVRVPEPTRVPSGHVWRLAPESRNPDAIGFQVARPGIEPATPRFPVRSLPRTDHSPAQRGNDCPGLASCVRP